MVYGKVPFFYYVLHFYLIHIILVVFFFAAGYGADQIVTPQSPFLFRPNDFGYQLPIVYLIWLGVVALLYRPCIWFENYKASHKQWWLKYLWVIGCSSSFALRIHSEPIGQILSHTPASKFSQYFAYKFSMHPPHEMYKLALKTVYLQKYINCFLTLTLYANTYKAVQVSPFGTYTCQPLASFGILFRLMM